MSEKRKDRSGRILRSGEYQRKNGTYDYRYIDGCGKHRSVYAKTLGELRRKEEEIRRDLADGIDPAAGEISVEELVAQYMNLKRDLSQNSSRAYRTVIRYIKSNPLGRCKVKNVKPSDAKGFYIEMHDKGMKRNTISVYHCVLRPAFEMAVDDDMIRKNPFKFKLADIIPRDAENRDALSKAQQEAYLRFIRDSGKSTYYDDIEILLGTGLRVSELYGLTKSDVDMINRRIHVQKQLCRTAEKPYFVAPPKTASGDRYIPMDDQVYAAFVRVMKNRTAPSVEWMVDGYAGFLFLDQFGKPKVAMHLENYMRNMQRKYAKLYKKPFPRVTPHVLRHTFCTNMQRAGIDVKTLQYLMGHSHVSVTLDVYTHTDLDAVQAAFDKAVSNL